MNVLDSHVEALAINYVRFGFFTLVNNLWRWVGAVVTAAISFWRLRVDSSASSSPSCPLQSDSENLNANGSQPALNVTPTESELMVYPPSTTTTITTSALASASAFESALWPVCDFEDGGGATKGRFTVYYGGDSESYRRLTVAGEWDDNNDGGGFDLIFGVRGAELLEKVVSMRMGDDMGWYRFQDLRVINGNVVKLWDGCRNEKLLHHL